MEKIFNKGKRDIQFAGGVIAADTEKEVSTEVATRLKKMYPREIISVGASSAVKDDSGLQEALDKEKATVEELKTRLDKALALNDKLLAQIESLERAVRDGSVSTNENTEVDIEDEDTVPETKKGKKKKKKDITE